MIYRSFLLSAFLLTLSTNIFASVALNLDIGRMTDSNSVTLPGGTLWALISEDSSGNLPGALLADGSLYENNNTQTIVNDFAGATIAVGNTIGGGTIVGTGGISTSFAGSVVSTVNFDETNYGLTSGDKLGIYWFPGLTTTSNTIPSNSDFEIGGFQRTSENTPSGGTGGLVVPGAGNTVNAYFLDSEIETNSGINQTSFEAVAVPEVSTLLFLSISLVLQTLRRRF